MAWQHFLFETRTGNLTHEVLLSSHSWQTRLNGYGSGSSTVYVGPVAVPPAGGWADATTPWSRGIVSLWNGVPVYAGIIDQRSEMLGSGAIQLRHAEVWKLLARRYLWGVRDYTPNDTRVANGLTRRGIVMWLLNYVAVTGSTSTRWSLPFSIPALELGTRVRTYRAYRFEKGMDILQRVLDETGGPDLYLRPRLTALRTLEWRAEVGNPRVAGVAVDWQWGPVDSPVADLSFSEDAADQLTGAFALGEGTEADMLVGKGTTSLELDLPVMDLAESAKHVEEQDEIDSLAQGIVDQRATLQGQWDMTVFRDVLDRGVMPGARPRLRVEGSVLAPSTDWRDLYVVEMSGDLSESVKVGVQTL